MTFVGHPPFVDLRVQACDLCWRPIAEREYLICELRAVCLDCLARFQEHEPEVNVTLGLVKRGLYSQGRTDPGLNDLGGR